MAAEERMRGIIGGKINSGSEGDTVKRRKGHPLLYIHILRDKIQADMCSVFVRRCF